MKKAKLTTAMLALLVGTAVAPMVVSAETLSGEDLLRQEAEQQYKDELAAEQKLEQAYNPEGLTNTPTKEETEKEQAEYGNGWNEFEKQLKAEQDWDTPTAKEGKDAEDAHADEWEATANEANKKEETKKE